MRRGSIGFGSASQRTEKIGQSRTSGGRQPSISRSAASEAARLSGSSQAAQSCGRMSQIASR